MNNVKLFRLRNKIFLRKLLLNLLLFSLCPTNQIIVALSQNLDKHIVSYQKELFIKYCLNTLNNAVLNSNSVINYFI